ncbi:Mu transposase C-terminal domain-containing protein [Burkholderia arboris]|uniref:Mu transposase C-terminal domain-containing protein n=1 Tax=Burkholderia metallica TaxID=488729 RepID=A0ABT8PJ36_9BURK|nr:MULTISPECIES: Mu transposase C-terminal domain-containing protein [Burkholderia cepacia complex]MCA8031988.1 Mu transposase C-terminal domain-containing protein [Burkholderia arboris]MDN7935158.1 Mu transposase C-terminal domain-containing protein [Burkholderia metallica]
MQTLEFKRIHVDPEPISAPEGRAKGGTVTSAENWLSVKEAAPLLGIVERAVKRACQNGKFRTKLVQGNGGQQYRIDPLSLPEAARDVWLARQVSSAVASSMPFKTEVATIGASANHVTLKQRVVADSRLLIVRAVRTLQNAIGTQRRAILALLRQRDDRLLSADLLLAMALGNARSGLRFSVELNKVGLPVATPVAGQDVAAFAAQLTQRSIERWCLTDSAGIDLAPAVATPDVSVKPWVPYFLAEMQRPQKPTLADAYRDMLAALPADITPPSYHSARRWYLQKYSALDRQRGRHQGSALNPFKFAHRRTSRGMVPMQEIHSDGWGTHFTAPHPISGKFVKLEVWHTHDVATRRVFPPSVGLSESMLVIMGSLFNAIKIGGVPAVWQTDNTGSVKNDRVELDPLTSIKARAGFEIVHNLPGNSQANGICENFNKYLDRRSRKIATYMSKDMDKLAQKRVLKITQKMTKVADIEERRKLKAQAEAAGSGIVFETYQQAVDWLTGVIAEYNDQPHSALPRITLPDGSSRRMTPNEAWAQHVSRGWQPVALDADELADTFRPHEIKPVRRGCVQLFGQRYRHAELAHFNGEDVLVAYDVDNGERVFVKTLDGRPLCVAEFYTDRAYRARSFYDIAMERRADVAIKRHETKIDEIERQRPVVTLEAQIAQQRRIESASPAIIDVEAKSVAEPFGVMRLPVEPEQKYLLWQKIDAALTGDADVPDWERTWHETYQHSNEFTAMKKRFAVHNAPIKKAL